MNSTPPCPECNYEYTYENDGRIACPDCGHEWDPAEMPAAEETRVWKDANGNVLNDGDTVITIKDLKVKGASSVLKAGTKVKKIRLASARCS